MDAGARRAPLAAAFAAALAACDDGAGGPIEILIDTDGVPHVYAASDEDAFFGVGYMTARDRLYQLEMMRRFALGRRAEVLGEDALADDQLARFADLRRWGRADFERTEEQRPERAALVRAWVDGINRRIEEVREGDVPPPFGFRELDFLPEAWAQEDPYVILKGAGLANDQTIEFEMAVTLLMQLFPDAFAAIELVRPARPAITVPPEELPEPAAARRSSARRSAPRPGPTWEDLDEAGRAAATKALRRLLDAARLPRRMASNNWALGGGFTANGRPLLAGDPHLAFDFFGAPYPLHMNSKDAGGAWDVAGIVYPGTPGIALGANGRLAWAVTTAAHDVTDVWEVERDGDGVRLGGDTVPVTVRREEIVVRRPDGPVGEGQTVAVEYEDVEGFGVLLPPELTMGLPLLADYMVGWTGFAARPMRWFMEVNDVETLDDFDAAVDRCDEMNYHFVAATAEGITYRVGVEVPDRADWLGERAPWRAMRGDDAGSLWTGDRLPPEKLPRGRDPARGWLATANNDPFGFTLDGDVENDPWYVGALFDPGYRAQRAQDELSRLAQRGSVDAADMEALQTDARSLLADGLVPLLAAAHARVATDDALAEFRGMADLDRVVALLTEEWDRRMTRDSAGAVAFHAFAHFASAAALRDDVVLAYDFAIGLLAPYVFKIADLALRGEYPRGDEVLQEGGDWILLDAARSTAAFLVEHFGAVDPSAYAYRDVKFTSFADALGAGFDLGRSPSDGGEDTINVSTNMPFDPAVPEWVSSWVAVTRHVFEFDSDQPRLRYSTPFVGPGEPDTPENEAAMADYLDGRYRRMRFGRDEIEAALARRIEIAR